MRNGSPSEAVCINLQILLQNSKKKQKMLKTMIVPIDSLQPHSMTLENSWTYIGVWRAKTSKRNIGECSFPYWKSKLSLQLISSALFTYWNQISSKKPTKSESLKQGLKDKSQLEMPSMNLIHGKSPGNLNSLTTIRWEESLLSSKSGRTWWPKSQIIKPLSHQFGRASMQGDLRQKYRSIRQSSVFWMKHCWRWTKSKGNGFTWNQYLWGVLCHQSRADGGD